MKSIPTQLWRTGEILSPTSLRRAYDGIARDRDDVNAQRYTYSQFVVPLHEITHDDGAAEKNVIIKPPFACEILSVELAIAGDDGSSGACTFTLSQTGAVGWEDVAVSASSQTAYARAQANFVASIAASQEVVFTIGGSTATWTIAAGYAVIGIRADRWQGQASTNFSPRNIKSGIVTTAADISSTFDDYDTDGTAQATNTDDWRIEIISLARNIAAADFASVDHTTRHTIPAAGRIIDSGDFILVRDTVAACRYLVYDEAFATVTGIQTVNAAGSATPGKSQGNDFSDETQPDDPDTLTSDYQVRCYSSSGTSVVLKAYAVIYYK